MSKGVKQIGFSIGHIVGVAAGWLNIAALSLTESGCGSAIYIYIYILQTIR